MYRKKEQEIYNTIFNFYKNYGYGSKMTTKERLGIANTRITSEEKIKAYSKAGGESVKRVLSYAGSTRKDLLEAQINDSIASYYRSLNIQEKDIKSIMDNMRYPINSAINNALNTIGDPRHASLRVVAEFDRQTSLHARTSSINRSVSEYPSDATYKIIPENGACETCQSYAHSTYTYEEAVAVLDGAHPNCRCQIVSLEQREMEETWIAAINDTIDRLFETLVGIKEEVDEVGVLGYAWRKYVDMISASIQGVSLPITYTFELVNEFIQSNYKENQDTQKKIVGFINDQFNSPVAEIKMGYYGADWNGCGWIATYNAMLLLEAPQKPADIVKYYETVGGTVLNGAFGTNSIAINQYFKTKGLDTKYMSWPAEMDTKIEDSGAAVLEYAHSGGFHYVTVNYNNGVYTIYNNGGSDNGKTVETKSIDEWVKEKDYLPLVLITAKKQTG